MSSRIRQCAGIALVALFAALTGQATAMGLLPDNRQYELVSPPDKHGGDVLVTSWRTRVAAKGDAFGYASLTGFADVRGVSVATDYVSVRSTTNDPGSNGWSTHAISPAQGTFPFGALVSGYEPLYVRGYSADMTTGVFYSWSPVTDDPMVKAVPNLYLRTDLLAPGAGRYLLLTECPLCTATGTPLPLPPLSVGPGSRWRPAIAAATPAFDHIIFESRQVLTNEVEPQPVGCTPGDAFLSFLCRLHLYEWDHGTLRLAGVLPDGTPADVSVAGQGAQVTPNLTPGVLGDGSDGHTRIFFTQPTNALGQTSKDLTGFAQLAVNISPSGNLFMRVDNATTEQLNRAERAAPDVYAPATYLNASKDGTRAFFLTAEALTDDAPPDGQEKIYMYSVVPNQAHRHLTFVSIDPQTGNNLGIAAGVIGVGESGDYVYFLANDAMYVWHDGGIRYIGPAPQGSDADEDIGAGRVWALRPWQASVTPDGRHLMFSAHRGTGLTEYEHNGFREMYVYSADSGRLACVSCNPSGAGATGDAFVVTPEATSGGTRLDPTPGTGFTADGSRVFFSSPEPLVTEDTNGRMDAYEYNVETGVLALLSSGEAPSDSYFLGADATGNNVFIATRQALVGWDVDAAYDAYDVRVGGGFPEPPEKQRECDGEGCRGPSGGATPSQLASGSAKFLGAGNEPVQQNRAKNRRGCGVARSKQQRRQRRQRRCLTRGKRRRGKSSHGARGRKR